MPTDLIITIYGQHAKLTGEYSKDLFTKATSYKVEGSEFSPAFRRGVWDGTKKLGFVRTGSFPTGLVPDVKAEFEAAGHSVVVVDRREEPGRMDLWGTPSFELANGIVLRDYQLAAAQAAYKAGSGVIKVATGGGKTVILAGLINARNVTTLVIVPSRELLHQTRKSFLHTIPGATEETIGIVGDDEWLPGKHVTVATLSTLYARMDKPECAQLLNSIELLCLDESHMAGADTYFDVCQACPAYFRVSMSGTPFDRQDGGTKRLIASFGDKLADVGYKELVDKGVLPRAKIIFDKVTGPIIPKKPKLNYQQVYKQGVVENPNVTKKVVEWTKICVDQGLSVLVLVDLIEHGKLLSTALWSGTDGNMIPHTYIHGSSTNRDEALREFEAREIPVLVASSILDTGISLNSIDVLIMAGSRKSKIKTLQKLGRALRGDKAIVIEFFSFCHNYLLEHSKTRFQDYKNENTFILKQSAPNADLIKRLWEMP